MKYIELTNKEKDMIPFKDQLNIFPKLLVLEGTNNYFDISKKYAEKFSSDPTYKLCSLIVKNNKIIGVGSNSSHYHENEGCRRKDKEGNPIYKSGEGYNKCPGCNPETSHSELLAIRNSILSGFLVELKNNEKLLEIYKELIGEFNKGVLNSNIISIVDYNQFMSTVKNILGESEFIKLYEKIEEELKNSTLYLYGHYWACKSCWNKCKDFGISNIIVQKSSFNLHNGR